MTKTKIRHLLSPQRIAALAALVFLIILSLSADFLMAQAITQGYDAEGQLQRGMIVRIKESDTTKVEALKKDDAAHMHGVVVNANDAPVTLSAEGQKVFVATAGQYDVLVSDQNGTIKPGEYVTISSLAGIGMKVDDKQPVVIGKSLTEFTGQSDVVSSSDIEGKKINIGRVKVDILVARNPLQKPTESNLPEFLRKAAENIAGKPVNTTRLYLSLLVFFISAIISGSLLYSGVRSGIISVGRNPLSKKFIIRSMMQVIIVGITIFVSGLFGVYLLLRL